MRPPIIPIAACLTALTLVATPASELSARAAGAATAPLAATSAPALASNCAGTSTGLIPINDLGVGFYQGAQGGLYAGGSNHRPVAHNAAGIAIAQSLSPLDTLGNPAAAGKVVMVSIGLSNTTQEFSVFVPKCVADAQKRANVVPIDCAVGGQTASIIKNPAAWYWDTVATRLRGRGLSPNQVQVIWIKEANSGPTGTFNQFSDALVADFGAVVRTMKAKLPNAKLAYFTSRIYAGYASSSLNPEPYAYASGFVVKRLISAQIAGVDSLNYDPNTGPVAAPWLAWGPYLWADGLTPRSDGLTWACADFNTSDGTHPSTSGRDRVADSLLAFFRADETTRPWYSVNAVGVPPLGPRDTGALSLTARPLPAGSEVTIRASRAPAAAWRLEVMDAAGRRVRSLGGGAVATPVAVRWDLRDDHGQRAPAGVYWARLDAGGERGRAKIVVR